jgi:hypothetical protein
MVVEEPSLSAPDDWYNQCEQCSLSEEEPSLSAPDDWGYQCEQCSLFLGLVYPTSGKIVYSSETGTKRGLIATQAITDPAESQRVVTIAVATNERIIMISLVG